MLASPSRCLGRLPLRILSACNELAENDLVEAWRVLSEMMPDLWNFKDVLASLIDESVRGNVVLDHEAWIHC